ncbi:MAG: glycosyltransferase family 39 protein [Thermoanaerobaculia bacterium]|nr:glycosyltransferase family 39 protein [Thermoanaerobaculia bacterium]
MAFALVVAAAASVYAFVLFSNVSLSVGGSDSSGYLNVARMLSGGRTSIELAPLRELGIDRSFRPIFTPIGFTWGIEGTRTMAPGYPPGLPLHLATAAAIGGWERAPFYLMPVVAVGCGLLMVLLARQLGLSREYAVAGAAILVLLPQFVTHALQPVSDVLATFWALAAISLALGSERRHSLAFLSGIAFAVGVWVRPTNCVLVIALVLAVGLRPRLLLRIFAGGLPLGIALAWYQQITYGSPLKTGYGLPLDVLTIAGFATCFRIFATWMLKFSSPIIFPAGLLVVLEPRIALWRRLMLPAWFVSFFLFYCLWWPYEEWWSLRFLLPGTPALIFGSLLVLHHLRERAAWRRTASVVAAVLIGIAVFVPARQSSRLSAFEARELESIYPEAVRWTESQLPRNAIVLSGALSGGFFYYSNRFTARVDQLDDAKFQTLRAYAGNRNLAWYAALLDGEAGAADLSERLKGEWTLIGRYRHMSLWRLDS